MHCTCPDQANPCKHLAATAYVLAEKLDRDPYLLFLLRGRSAAQVEEELRERWDRDLSEDVARAQSDTTDSAELRPEDDVDLFWANEMEGPILFTPRETSVVKLTIERMSVPEPKIDEKLWGKTLQAVSYTHLTLPTIYSV